MHRYFPLLKRNLLAILILGSALGSLNGCARWQVPRINPQGDTIFLPANGPVATPGAVLPAAPNPYAGAAQASLPTTITPPEVQTGAPSGRTYPAFTQPPVPPPCNANTTARKHLVPDPNRCLKPGQAGQLIMTPSRIVAPVGSEVVVLAGICGPDSYFLKNQPLEWMLSNNSVGEIIEVGGLERKTLNRLIPPAVRKRDGQYAQGRTGIKRMTLSRGTPTTTDDIDLASGQTFISVASASPGNTYVTGVAPNAEGWDRRRASTVIHWVDANWSIPVPQTATAGTVTGLTTVVARADGSGVADWQVRYSIVGGAPAEFAPTGSQTAEVATNRQGQATAQLRQPAGQFEPGVTQVRVEVVRPPVFGEPELVVECGLTSVTWSAPALTIRAIGPRTADRSTPFNYRIEVTNPGDQPARGVVLRTKDLSDAVEFISSDPKPTEFGRQYQWDLGDLAPGASARVVDVQLRSQRPGKVGLCFEVSSDQDRLQTEACAETEITQPCIGLSIDGPSFAAPGQPVTFTIRVQNNCNQPLENVEMQIGHDPGLVRAGRPNPTVIRLDNQGVLAVNDSASFEFQATAQTPGQQCLNVQVTANGVRAERDRKCITVGPVAGTPDAGAPAAGPLKLEVTGGQAVTVAGVNGDEVRSRVLIRITNDSTLPINNLALISRPSDALEAEFISKPYDQSTRQVAGSQGETITSIPQIGAGQTLVIELDYRGLRADTSASTEISVSAPQGGTATRRIAVPAVLPQDVPADPNAPQFNPQDDRPIQIPDDNTASQSTQPIELRLESSSNQIRRGESAQFQFSIRNPTRHPVHDVDIDLRIPPGLAYRGQFSNSKGLPLLADGKVPRLRSLQAGEQVNFQVSLEGQVVGSAPFEVRVDARQLASAKFQRAQVAVTQ